MKKITFTAKGVTPLLMHKFNIEQLTNQNKIKEGTTGNNPNEWKTSIYHEGRRFLIPASNLHATISNGGKYIKAGRGTLVKVIPSAIRIPIQKFFINRELPDDLENLNFDNMTKDSSQPCYIDVRAVNNPATKGKNIRYRMALSPGWEAKIELEWNDTIVSRDQIEKTIISAGELVGILEARSLGYGRFNVEDFSVSDI